MTTISAVGFLSVFFMQELAMHTEVDDQWTLKETQKQNLDSGRRTLDTTGGKQGC